MCDTPEFPPDPKTSKRAYAKARGTCIVCLRRRAMEGHAKCAVCSEDGEVWMMRARAHARRAKFCPLCLKTPVTPGRRPNGKPWTSCAACREKAKAARHRRMDLGLVS